MFSQILLTLAFATVAFSYMVTSPGGSAGWTNVGPQPAQWQRVVTDRENFTAVLTNVRVQSRQVLAALVNGSLGETTFSPPSGGWPVGLNFRLNFEDPEQPGAILAQSNEFSILAPSGSASSISQTQLNSPSTPNPIRPATTTASAPTATTSSANPNQSNAATLANEVHHGVTALLLGVLAVIAA